MNTQTTTATATPHGSNSDADTTTTTSSSTIPGQVSDIGSSLPLDRAPDHPATTRVDLVGNNAANVLKGSAGNDTLVGGAGIDIAAYSGARSQYTWSREADGALRVNGPEGSDRLVNIERLSFSDGNIAFDAESTGGQAYRLYQAAFQRAPDVDGLGFQINALDSGYSLHQVAQNFLDSPEFRTLYGTSLDDRTFVTKLYENVLNRGPDAEGLAFQMAALAGGRDRAQLLVDFSESAENQLALVGVIQAGVVYG